MHELGRRHAPDPRDKRYMLADVLPLPALSDCPAFKYRWEQFNEDQTGDTCVANASTHFLGDGPRSHKLADLDAEHAGYTSPQSGQAGFRGYLYDQAQQLDEWTDTPPEGGTSVRAGFKALAQMGHIGEYRWLTGVTQVAAAILTYAPVVIGINWYESMMGQPFGSWLKPSGSIVGGHAVCLSGCNQTGVGKVKIQTWGGHYWLKFSDLARLLSEDGEAAVGLEP
jgi:hypothetical protein